MAKANKTTEGNKAKGRPKKELIEVPKLELIEPELKRNAELELVTPNSEKNVVSEKTIVDNTGYDKSNDEDKNQIGFSFNAPIYLEIHRNNIFYYFSAGLVMASKYISNRAFPDVQSINDKMLIISNGASLSANVDSILLQLELNDFEKKDIIVQSKLGYLSQPIPITRVTKIYVANDKIKEEIISDALIHDGGYIPSKLIEAHIPKGIDKTNFIDYGGATIPDFTTQIRRFDKTLGLLAFLRNYSILVSEKNDSYKTLPNHFFYAIQALDKKFGENIVSNPDISKFYSYLIANDCPDDKQLLKWIFNRIDIENNFNDNDTREFESLFIENSKDLEHTELFKQYFAALYKTLERKDVLFKIDTVQSKSKLPLYLFSFLRNYASFTNIELPRRDISKIYSEQLGEYAFAVLGYFFGYRRLRNSDERLTFSNVISRRINPNVKPAIKFQLSTYFDYYIIELVFNFIFYNNFSGVEINHTRYANIISEQLSNIKPESVDFEYREALIYGKLYQNMKKIDPLDELIPLIKKLPENIPLLSDLGLYCFRLGLRMKPFSLSDLFVNSGSIMKLIGYDREDLTDAVTTRKIDSEELKLRITLSQKHKEI